MINSGFAKLKTQVNLFYLALSFFTRLPVPKSMQYSADLLNQANRYFSLVGVLLGLILTLAYLCFNFFLPSNISILLMMSFSLLLTGAFHEDGLADMADGMGGGFTREKKLAIMKDSRIGTYGSVTLIMALLTKYALLVELSIKDGYFFFVAIIVAESLSRAVAGSLISSLPYVTDNESSKSKPLAQKQSPLEFFVLVVIGVLPLCYFSLGTFVLLILLLVTFRWLFRRWLLKRLSGFTGDCLGAAQQISQLLIYLALLLQVNSLPYQGGII